MPPIVLQRRGSLTPCDDESTFSTKLQQHVAEQFTRKCVASYACDFPDPLAITPNDPYSGTNGTANVTNFACVDREKQSLATFWDANTTTLNVRYA